MLRFAGPGEVLTPKELTWRAIRRSSGLMDEWMDGWMDGMDGIFFRKVTCDLFFGGMNSEVVNV